MSVRMPVRMYVRKYVCGRHRGPGGIAPGSRFGAGSWDFFRPVQGGGGAGARGAPLACARPVRLGRAPPPAVPGDLLRWRFSRVRVPPSPCLESADSARFRLDLAA